MVTATIHFANPSKGSLETAAIIGFLTLLDAAVHLGFAILILLRKRWSAIPCILFMIPNLILTVTDDFGAADLVILFPEAAVVILVFLYRALSGHRHAT